MYDIEKVISARIRRDTNYIKRKSVEPSMAYRKELEIMTLKSAPRREKELTARIKKVKLRIKRHGNFDNLFLERLRAELEALEWLLQLIKYGRPLAPEWSKS